MEVSFVGVDLSSLHGFDQCLVHELHSKLPSGLHGGSNLKRSTRHEQVRDRGRHDHDLGDDLAAAAIGLHDERLADYAA